MDHGRHTHLAYELEKPEEPGVVQKQFCILKEGNYIISIKVLALLLLGSTAVHDLKMNPRQQLWRSEIFPLSA